MAATDVDAHSRIAFSRSTGLPLSLGKATETAKTSLPESVKEDLLKRARSVGMTEAEFLRSVILVTLYGLDEVAIMERDRLAKATRAGPELGVNSVTNGESF